MKSRVVSARGVNRVAGLVACLPLAVGLSAAAAGFVQEQVSRHLTDRRLGAMTGRQAAASARQLTATIFGGHPAETLSVAGYSNGVRPGAAPGWNTWEVSCRTAEGDFFYQINADSGEPVAVRRELSADADAAPPANGDLGGGVSHREALLHARRYLRLAGLPVPASERPIEDHGFDFTFRVAAARGAVRTLCVSVNPMDGSLDSLLNMVGRQFGPGRLPTAPRRSAGS